MSAAPQRIRTAERLDFQGVDEQSLKVMTWPGRTYFLLLAVFAAILAAGVVTFIYQVYTGIGVSGMGQPVMWAFYVNTFVFWVGIGHSGTLISAVLYLFRSRWRASIYRCAETMTVFAISIAGLFPIIHLGRPWFFYWLFFYPNERVLQPDFHSPLVWDAFAIGTYLIVSCIFLYIGAIPDLATVASSSTGIRSKIYRIISLGWRGDQRQWRHFSTVYLLMAGLATPLVISVHSVVSFDFAMAQLPGWHDTIFAPYFVASAIYSGLGMLMMLLPLVRRLGRFEDEITIWHFDQLGKLALLMSLIISYSYLSESFMAWYSNDPFERTTFTMRYFGPYAALFWMMCWCNAILPLTLFSKKLRTNLKFVPIMGFFAFIGVWLDHFVIIAGSLTTNFIPSQWKFYAPTWPELVIEAASLAMFIFLYMLAFKVEPLISMSEIKTGLSWLDRALQRIHAKR
ncbi:MAG TPA: NrfD/PsrC family molybdoenzyme membrane anchor subunit [Candidatus Binataceae bacterium]|nr:NrfD/PsrC family molybdoenzyme membrane anchor subunit [Candidatus Binataceae bacterium]